MLRNRDLKIQKKKLIINRKNSENQRESKVKELKTQKIQYFQISQKKNTSLFSKSNDFKKTKLRTSSSQYWLKDNKLPPEGTKKTTKKLDKLQNYQTQQNNKISESKSQQQIRLISLNSYLEGLMLRFIGEIKMKPDQFKIQVNTFNIDKNYFIHLIEYLISTLSSYKTNECHKLFHALGEVTPIYDEVHDYCIKHRASERKQKSKLCSEVISLFYNNYNLTSEMKSYQQYIEYYTSAKLNLQRNIKELVLQKEKNISIVSQQAKIFQERVKVLTNYQQNVKSLEKICQQLNIKIKNQQIDIQKRNYEAKNIENYVTQASQMFKLISEEYKEIEDDIYEYAVYLQSNELASNLDYETHPFRQLQFQLRSQLQLVCTSIMNQKQQVKRQLTRDFLLKSFQFFQKKDEDTNKICTFRAQCIRQFITKMKKWLNNWQLKKQFLVNLRQQFGVDNKKMKKYLSKLTQLPFQNIQTLKFDQLIDQISKVYDKIQKNYKMGNSFY